MAGLVSTFFGIRVRARSFGFTLSEGTGMRLRWHTIRTSFAVSLLGMVGCAVSGGTRQREDRVALEEPRSPIPVSVAGALPEPNRMPQAATRLQSEREAEPIRLVGRDEERDTSEVAHSADAIPDEFVDIPSDSELTLTLYDVIGLALRTSPDVGSAMGQLQIADATLDRARAEFYPKLGISEAYGISNNPVQAFMFRLNQSQFQFNQDFNQPKAIDDFHTQVRVAHRLYAGGRRLAEEAAAVEGVSAASHGLAAVQNQLVYHVAEAYYRLLQARELVGVRTEAVEQVRRHLHIVRTRYKAQTAVKSDVLSVEVRLAEVREALISSRNQVELAWAVLASVIGTPVDRQPLPSQVPTAPWSNHVDEIQQSVAEALGRRPEMGQLASRRAAAASRVVAARAGKRLSVDFVTDYDVFTGDFAQGNDSFFTGLVAELNLFDGGRSASEVRQAMGRVRQLEAEQRRVALDIELDVRRAYLQLDDAQQRLQVTSQAIGQARESLREIEVRYRRQAVTVVELIDAQVALSNARVRDANARAEVEVARAALERSIGRLTDFVGTI
ncbi:MAG: TolC family protein [Pirellulales bacterium]